MSDTAADRHIRRFLTRARESPQIVDQLGAISLERRSKQIAAGRRWSVVGFLLAHPGRDEIHACLQFSPDRDDAFGRERRRIESIARELVVRLSELGFRGRWHKAERKHGGFAHLSSVFRLGKLAEAREFLDSIRLAELLTSSS